MSREHRHPVRQREQALAGVLVSALEQFSPFSGFPFTIAGFIVIILGGLGNVSAGLAAALRRVLEKPDFAESLRRRARIDANRYAESIIANSYLTLFKQAVASP